MRRWIAIFLIVLLPLQFSWAVAADYCLDEQGSGAAHFGHHAHPDHEHAGVDDGSAKVAKSPTESPAQSLADQLDKGKQHPEGDCGCSGHLCGAHLLPAGLDALFGMPPSPWLSTPVSCVYPPADPNRIERPNWSVSP
jgi:hypothetical protein